MDFLLDMQVLIWHAIKPKKLSDRVRQMISDTSNSVSLAQLSFFEIAIKQKVGKLDEFSLTISELVDLTKSCGIILHPLQLNHLAAYERIPLFFDYRDPIDRLLLASALVQEMPIISADRNFSKYKTEVTIIAA